MATAQVHTISINTLKFCNSTLHPFVYNLTSSYTNQRNEATMVATSVVMFLLAALFFNLNLFSGFSDVSAILNPSVRLFLSTSLSLFLPVMSYLFSEAKNDASSGQMAELSIRARTILMWMLLVELLRKKVETNLITAGMKGYSGTIERSTRIAWLGYLVFFNLQSAGKKALYSILWVLAAAKLVQRFVTSELAKRSFAYGKNPQLLASYMAQVLQLHQEQEELLKRCNYAVIGEEDLEKKAVPGGYHLELKEAVEDANSTVVTVGKIWKLAETDELLKNEPKLKRLCLSFALYKLLRRRLEDFPITDAEARDCHDLIFKGLRREAGTDGDAAAAVAVFQVFSDEVQFLCEHYHSVIPVVLASPFFFLVNYILFPVVVGAVCVLTIILCSNGDVRYAFHSFSADNYAITVGVSRMAGCMLRRITQSPTDLYAGLDVSITVLLLLAFVYEEVWEVIQFLLSNWFVVSLLCSYTSESDPRRRSFSGVVIRSILWVRRTMSEPTVRIERFSVLCFRRLPNMPVPKEAKKAIMERLASAGDDVTRAGNGGLAALMSSLRLEDEERSWAACENDGVAEVILTWHIATELLEARRPLPKKTKPGADRKVAVALSGYCTYLVAFHPELLPDDTDSTKQVYRDTKEELKKEMGCWRYYCSPPEHRYNQLMEIAGQWRPESSSTTLQKGARLGKVLIDKYDAAAATDDGAREGVWKLLADVWTEVVVYAGPTGSELHVKAHREALAQGGEFITVLWALATHTGITRRPAVATTAAAPPAACGV
ncbi:hypothetical protein ACP70R_041969 [Stipagrostis hirtigluma subsp. patula]